MVIFIDEVDMKILYFLWKNSNISFNKLGSILNISGNILKKRAEVLQENKIFSYASIPHFSLMENRHALVVFIIDIPKYHRAFYFEKISHFPNVLQLIFTLEEKAALVVLLPFNSEEGVSNFTIQKFINSFQNEIPNITIKEHFKLKYKFRPDTLKLKPAEIKFLRLLYKKGVNEINSISEELSLSKKTLSRYLMKFEENNLIRHSIIIQYSKIRNFYINLVLIKFENKNDLNKKIKVILKMIQKFLSYSIMVDPPGLIVFTYSPTLWNMEQLVAELNMLSIIKSIDIFFPSTIKIFDGWLDIILPSQFF
ncbi:MAG: hypothetical protein ACTSRZ_17075 [Promethearchaeota archaeon]